MFTHELTEATLMLELAPLGFPRELLVTPDLEATAHRIVDTKVDVNGRMYAPETAPTIKVMDHGEGRWFVVAPLLEPRS
jgi:hypothetical protein